MRCGSGKSVVWKFFKKIANNKLAVCTLCKAQFKYFGGTTNLRNHLVRKHPAECNETAGEIGLIDTEEAAFIENESLSQPEFAAGASKDNALPVVRLETRTSVVWNFFQKTADKKTAICSLCRKQLKYYVSTTNLIQHLVREHATEYNECAGDLNLNEFMDSYVTNENMSNFEVEVRENTPLDNAEVATPNVRSKKSIVWKFFKKHSDNKLVTCNLCKRVMKYFISTTNLKQHLIRKHPVEYNECVNKIQITDFWGSHESHEKVDESLAPTTSKRARLANMKVKFGFSETEKKSIDQSLLKMIVTECQPLSLVENSGFLEYSRKLNHSYTPPCKKTLSNMLPEVYNDVTSKIKLLLDSAYYIALTADIWKSAANKSYLTLTSHVIDNSKMRDQVLSTKEIWEGPDGEENIAAVFTNIFAEWNVDNKIVTIVVNDESNVENVIEKHLQKHHNPCVGNALVSIVTDVLNSDDNPTLLVLIKKCEALMEHFKDSIVVSETGIPLLKIKPNLLTRWNSSFLMMERLQEFREPLSVAVASLPDSPELLDDTEWEIISDCVLILKPFESMSKELSIEKYMTMSLITPLVRGLQHAIRTVLPKTDTGLILQQTLLDAITKRLGCYEMDEIAAKATFLDPRLKKTAFDLEENAINAQDWIVNELTEMMAEKSNSPQSSASLKHSIKKEKEENTVSLWSDFDTKLAQLETTITTKTTAALMVTQYLEMPYLHRTQNPLDFWEKYKDTFPELYLLHLKYLSIPATSVPSARIFSKAGQLTNLRRNYLSAKNLDTFIFLNNAFENC